MATVKETRQSDAATDIIRPTIIEFILDETGSMASCKAATITGYNTFTTEQKNENGQALMTLTKFDTGGQRTPYVDLPLDYVIPMTDDTFCPGSSTNLRDTIGRRVRSLQERLKSWTVQPNVLVIVMTDGGDNASREYSPVQVSDMIKAREAEGWTFVYLGAFGTASATALEMGFQPGNIKQFSAVDMEQTMTTLSKATTAYRSSRASTTSSEARYFG